MSALVTERMRSAFEGRYCVRCASPLTWAPTPGKGGRPPMYCDVCRPKAVSQSKRERQRMRREFERRTALDAIRDDIRADEHAILADALARADALIDRLAQTLTRLERIGIAAAPANHHRIADGGIGARREHRKRAAA